MTAYPLDVARPAFLAALDGLSALLDHVDDTEARMLELLEQDMQSGLGVDQPTPAVRP